METGSPRQHPRKERGSDVHCQITAIEQHKKIEGKSKSGKLTNGRLKIEGMFILTVLLLTQHPQTGFLGSLSKDFARPITLLSIIFQSGMKEAFLPLSLSVNPAFITS